MWHEMSYGSRANWYLINVWPDCRAPAHLLHVSSNMHDLHTGFLPQKTFHVNVKWHIQAAQTGGNPFNGNAVNLDIFYVKCASMQYILCIRPKALKTMKCQRKSLYLNSSCVCVGGRYLSIWRWKSVFVPEFSFEMFISKAKYTNSSTVLGTTELLDTFSFKSLLFN